MSYYFLLQLSLSCVFFSSFDKKISNNIKKFGYFFLIVFLIIFTGLRYKVGGDWFIYNENFIKNSNNFNLFDLKIRSDYGWELISFFLSKLNLGYVTLNLAASTFFFISLSIFFRRYNYKLLSFIIAFPLIIVILLMGFTRQAVAFSFLLLCLKSLFEEKFFKSFIFIFLGIFFHKSIILFLFIYFLFPGKILKFLLNNLFVLITLVFIIIITFYSLYTDYYNIYTQYFGTNLSSNPESRGTYFRWIINFIPSLIFILFRNKFNINYIEKRIYFSFAIIIILSFFAINYYSTGTDRYLYYFSLIQVFVFANLPTLVNNLKKHLIFIILLYYLLILTIWLVYSDHSYLWTPYKFYFFNY